MTQQLESAWYFVEALGIAIVLWLWHLILAILNLAVGLFILGLLIWLILKLWRD